LLEAGFTFAAFVDGAERDLVPVAQAAPVCPATITQPASGVEQSLPLLI
jgi:hypothetical protein